MKEYPEPIARRSGSKVGWLTYADRETAEKASEAAKENAIEKERQGYDFGFQSPGWIDKVKDGFEVCIP